MRNVRLYKTFVIVLLIFWIIFYLFFQKQEIKINSTDNNSIEHLDIILSNGQSVQSKLLSLINIDLVGFTHVGIIIKRKDSIYVLHSTPDGTKTNSIRFDDMQTFIDLSNVNYFKILRFKNLNYSTIQNANSVIELYKKMDLPFDYDFDNFDKSRIYCSELVYDLFIQSGLFKTKLNLNKPIQPNEFTKFEELKCIYERKSTANKN